LDRGENKIIAYLVLDFLDKKEELLFICSMNNFSVLSKEEWRFLVMGNAYVPSKAFYVQGVKNKACIDKIALNQVVSLTDSSEYKYFCICGFAFFRAIVTAVFCNFVCG
jgi:hypothetical protein